MENQRLAVNTGVTLSSNLISACLSMIAIIGALILFVIEKREVGFLFYSIIILSFLSFILSIILGGKGIDIVRKEAYQDNLNLSCSKSKFNLQAVFCLLGIFFCIISFVFTSHKVEKNQDLEKLNINLLRIIEINQNEREQNKVLLEKLKLLENRVSDLEAQKATKMKKETIPNSDFAK